MAATTMGVKLDELARNRLKRLAKAKNRSAHWLMKTAILRYLDEEERFEHEKTEDAARVRRYMETGEHYTREEIALWLDGLAEEARQTSKAS